MEFLQPKAELAKGRRQCTGWLREQPGMRSQGRESSEETRTFPLGPIDLLLLRNDGLFGMKSSEDLPELRS